VTSPITRREALARLAAITGAVAIGAEAFVAGCSRAPSAVPRTFSAGDVALLDEIGDTIIPATDTPGAKSIGIGALMATLATDCYEDDAFASFRRGLDAVESACRAKYGTSFVQTPAAQRTALLNEIDAEQREHGRTRERDEPPHYFRLMKELTLLGYFSSEVGCTQALRYVESPGAYHGDVPYAKGDRIWFNPTRRVS
jgi:hypothetical protein